MADDQDFTVRLGSIWEIGLPFVDADGNPLDLTGGHIEFILSTESAALIRLGDGDILITTPTSGFGLVNITPAMQATAQCASGTRYNYAARAVLASGYPTEQMSGTVFVESTAFSNFPVTPDGTALFPYMAPAVATLRRDQLVVAAQNLLNGVTLTDDYLFGKMRAAESDAQRQLKVFFQPTVIIPDDAPQSEIDALVVAGTAYAQEAGYDFDPEFFQGERWGYTVVKHHPIISVQSMKFSYPAPGTTVFTVPADWIRLDKKYGHIRLLPTALSSAIPMSAFVIQALGGGRTIPFMIQVRYTAGLVNAARDFPDLVDTVKRMAVLRIIEDGFLPQSGSISADGLSHSLSYDMDKYRDAIQVALFGPKGSNGGLWTALHGVVMSAAGVSA